MTVFVDASFLIALFNKDDQLHQKAVKLSFDLEKKRTRFLTSNIVLAETINVIFRLKGPQEAKEFYCYFQETGIKEYFVPKALFRKAYSLLWQQKKKGLNFFDCLHIKTTKHLKIRTILTFDEYFRKQNLKIIGV